MSTAIVSDAAAVLRATGIIKAYIAADEDHLNAVIQAVIDDTPHNAACTFGAMVKIAAALAQSAGDRAALDNIQRQLVADEPAVTP